MFKFRQTNLFASGYSRYYCSYHYWPYRLAVLLFLLLNLCRASTMPAYAHGGGVINSGVTGQYEWLVAVNPYPTSPGPTVLTILIYDQKNGYAPVTDLQGVLLLAQPGSAQACCEPGSGQGPFDLITDPAVFPGDYSATVQLDKPGQWQAQFRLINKKGAQEIIKVVVQVDVVAGDGPRPELPSDPTVIAVTATAFALNLTTTPQAISSQNVSPVGTPVAFSLAQPGSPLLTYSASGSVALSETSTTTNSAENSTASGTTANLSDQRNSSPFGNQLWLWATLAAIPLALVAIWALRSRSDESNNG